jgi:hypothetical protein
MKIMTGSTGINRDDSRENGEVSRMATGKSNGGMSGGGFVDGKMSFAFDPSKFSAPAPAKPKYVDGKSAFAFDPSKFS